MNGAGESRLAQWARNGLAALSEPAILASNHPLAAIAAELQAPFTAPDNPDHPFSQRHWRLPQGSGCRCLLLLGSPSLLCLGMLWTAWRTGIRHIAWPVAGGWSRYPLTTLISRQITGKLAHLLWDRLYPLIQPSLQTGRWLGLRRLSTALLRRNLQKGLAAATTTTDSTPGRLLVVTADLQIGGAERRMVRILSGLAPAIGDLRLFCRSLDPGLGGDALLEPVRSLGIPLFIGDSLLGEAPLLLEDTLSFLPLRLREDVRLYREIFLRQKPETVFLWQDLTNVTAGIAAILAGVPRIVLSTVSVAPVHFHHYLPLMGTIYRLLAARPEVLIVNNSAKGAADYESWLELPAGSVRILRNGLNDIRAGCPTEAGRTFRQAHRIPLEAPVIGAVQRMAEVKDPALWLATAQELANRRADVRFLLVGDGPMLEQMKQWAAPLGERAVFTGAMEDPRPALDAMNIFLLTSRNEGLPNSLIEALMMGVPVVAARVGGVPEALADGVTGRLVDSREPKDFAEALLQLLAHPPTPQICRDFALERFGLERMVTTALDLLGYQKP